MARVYRDVDKRSVGATPLPPDAKALWFRDAGAAAASSDYYYVIKGLTLCNRTEGP